MNTRSLWSKILTVAGGLAMLVGGLDPLEGSILILPGAVLLAVGALLGQAKRRVIAYQVWALILVAIGVGATWGLSAVGGFGGSSGRSNWWGVLILPGLIGWSMALWGPGSPRWLSWLGVVAGLWYLTLALVAKGAVGIVCAILGVLTIGGCVCRLRIRMRARTMATPAGACVALVVLAGVFAGQKAEAGPPVAGAYSRTFNTPTNLNGVAVVGWVSFYSASNGVEFARLATDQVAWGRTPLPAGTGIHFTPEGKPQWCFLGRNAEIKGHLFIGGGHDWMTAFYPSGELEGGGLVKVETIDGIPCDSGAKHLLIRAARTSFHENGKLRSARVAETVTYRGQRLRKGAAVELKPDGSIESVK